VWAVPTHDIKNIYNKIKAMDKETCAEWETNKSLNPVTKRKLKENGPVYKKFNRYCKVTKKHCADFKNTPKINPLTKRKITPTAKNGVFQILDQICKAVTVSPEEEKKSTVKTPVNTPVKIPTPKKDSSVKVDKADNTEKNRRRLIAALKTQIQPLVNRVDTLENRVRLHNILEKYLRKMEPCLEEIDGKLWLVDYDKNPIVKFNNQIGSKSVNGVAYFNMGKGFARLLKFSCKIMPSKFENTKEVMILNRLTKVVKEGKFPNFPMMYKSMKCTKACKTDGCPDVTKKHDYMVVLNELANMDLETWFDEKHTEKDYESVIMQLILSIKYLHKMNIEHKDLHLKNVLIHKVTPGGYWHYKYDIFDIYVPNTGYFAVLWDFGQSDVNVDYNDTILNDYFNPLYLIANLHEYPDWKHKVLPPKKTVDIVELLHLYAGNGEEHPDIYTEDGFLNKVVKAKWSTIHTKKKPTDGVIINKVPYQVK
jgi:hypothetical protein